MVDPVSILAPANKAAPAPLDTLRRQAEELEGVFLNTLTKEMLAGIDSRGAFGGGFAEETWRSMQSEHFAASIAASGGIGLADQLVRTLIDIQAGSNGGAQ